MNPKSLENLKFGQNKTTEEYREIGKKGAEMTKVRKNRVQAEKNRLKILLGLPIQDPKAQELLEKMGIEKKYFDNEMLITVRLFKKALEGNVPAIQYIDEKVGLNPTFNLRKEEMEIKRKSLLVEQKTGDNTLNILKLLEMSAQKQR